eukprot:TRINITY_DN2898_c0_g1_i1.p1 TRINITY_DN2898_c0_g1~~TRINITY_DN2898_c0_g1_i1.p1  ORF type:complete len:711 (+),score=139.53 TRINITY_DN2898_c0_g1_i1:119-2251(+)
MHIFRITALGGFCVIALLSFVALFAVFSGIDASSELLTLTSHSKIQDEDKDILVVVHLSDVHMNRDVPERKQHLIDFCNTVIPGVQPKAVFLTGDLVDSMRNGGEHSWARKQNEVDWQDYKSALDVTNNFNPEFWFDMRGNHDVYDVPSNDSPEQYFKTYSVQGVKNHGPTHYIKTLKANHYGSHYNFVSLDAAFVPGITTPFGLYGEFDQAAHDIIKKSTQDNDAAFTIVLSHFPSFTLDDFHIGLVELNEENPPCPVHSYLCGHLHAENMFSHVDEGLLELEVADLKKNHVFRVMVFDHRLMSFTDTKLNEWPIIVITNPKDARFLVDVEPLGDIAISTHIRVLVFEEEGTTQKATVSVMIDGKHLDDIVDSEKCDCERCVLTPEGCATKMDRTTSFDHPLYTTAWNPKSHIIGAGLHEITVIAKTFDGIYSVKRQEFSIDGTTANLGISVMKAMQRVPLNEIFEIMWYLFAFMTLGSIFIPRLWRLLNKEKFMMCTLLDTKPENITNFQRWLATQSSLSHKSMAILTLGIVLTYGPMMMLPLIGTGRMCFVFLSGVVCKDDVGPKGVSALFSLITMGGLMVPSVFILARIDQFFFQISTEVSCGHALTIEELTKLRSRIISKNGYTRRMIIQIALFLIFFVIGHQIHFIKFASWTVILMFVLYVPSFVLAKTIWTCLKDPRSISPSIKSDSQEIYAQLGQDSPALQI